MILGCVFLLANPCIGKESVIAQSVLCLMRRFCSDSVYVDRTSWPGVRINSRYILLKLCDLNQECRINH